MGGTALDRAPGHKSPAMTHRGGRVTDSARSLGCGNTSGQCTVKPDPILAACACTARFARKIHGRPEKLPRQVSWGLILNV